MCGQEDPKEQAAMLERFTGKCELLGGLHHPCIVQFLGVCFEQGSPLPVLVMEYLHTTLTACLERYGVLPNEISYGRLRDVAKPKYTSKIDTYSYGVLIIHTLCGKWPFPEDVFRPDPRNPDAMIPVSEVERRAA